MRIAFIHTCLEPGRDGVGDHARLLARECSAQGHPSCILSLNDPFVSGEPMQHSSDPLSFRIGRNTPWQDRISQAGKFLDAFQPDWVSFQFVNYGYHPKGLVHGLAGRLRELAGNTPVELMMHELWIGGQTGAPLKERLVGALQRHFVLQTIRSLQPKVVHTSNPAHWMLLERYGIAAKILPLFGSIPVGESQDFRWLVEELRASGLDIEPGTRDQFWFFGLFGSLHPIWPPEPLLTHLKRAGRNHGRRIVFASIGRMGPGEELWNALASRYSPEIAFFKLGERTPERIDEFLRFVDYGIATTPWAIIGKSATTAAMLDHGLPVIVNRDELRFPFDVPQPAASPSLHKMDDDLPEMLPHLHRRPPRATAPEIARQMLDTMSRIVSR